MKDTTKMTLDFSYMLEESKKTDANDITKHPFFQKNFKTSMMIHRLGGHSFEDHDEYAGDKYRHHVLRHYRPEGENSDHLVELATRGHDGGDHYFGAGRGNSAHEALEKAVSAYKSDVGKYKPLTEALTSKKPATAAKLFQEGMEQRLDEISKKLLKKYYVANRKSVDKNSEIYRNASGKHSEAERAEAGRKIEKRNNGYYAVAGILGDENKLDKWHKEAQKKGQLPESSELSEVEAPSSFWNAGMARANPIKVSQPQPAEPGQFKATNVKSPTRLADRDSALEGAPRATRAATEAEATRRGPEKIELTGDWQADVPDHQFDPKLDSETEFYPLFSQFKSLGAIPSGPTMAWEEEQIDESAGFDPSYREHYVFAKNFGRNHPAQVTERGRVHKMTTADGTIHEARISTDPAGSSYHAEVSSENHGYKRLGTGQGTTSKEAFHNAHQKYKENFKMPEYMKEDELSEISKETLGRYINRASHGEVEGKPYKNNNLYKYGEKRAEQTADREKFNKAENDIKRVGPKSYSRELDDQLHDIRAGLNNEEGKRARKEYNRVKGIKNAVGKLTGTAKVPAGEKQRPIEMLKKISEAEDKKKVDSVTEETLNEISKDSLKSYSKKASAEQKGLAKKITNDFSKMKDATDWSPGSPAMKAAERTNSIKHKFFAHKKGIETAKKKLVKEETLDEGLFDPAKYELLSLWDEHARRSDAHGSGSRAEILKRIESHVAEKHGDVGLKKMRLHTDLTNALKNSTVYDKGHLQTLLGNMRAKCSLEG